MSCEQYLVLLSNCFDADFVGTRVHASGDVHVHMGRGRILARVLRPGVFGGQHEACRDLDGLMYSDELVHFVTCDEG